MWRFISEARKGPDGDFAIVTKTYGSFERNILPEIYKILGYKTAQYAYGKRVLHIGNRKCHVITADDAAAESKFRGCTLAGAYVDEITIIPENVFLMLMGRLSIPGSKLFGTTNPDSPYHWFKLWSENNADLKSFKFVMDDNPQLTQEKKDFYKRQFKGLWYKRFIEGKWVQAEGSVYDSFDDKIHVISSPFSTAIHYICGVDYGTTNPCAFVLIGYNPHKYPNIWVESEYYYNSRVSQRQKTDAEYADDLRNFLQYKNCTAIYLDPSAASFRAELIKKGFSNVIEAHNEVVDGIRFVSDRITEGSLKICKNCVHLIAEFQSYVWDDKSLKLGIDKPKKENDHALDALRYALFTHFFGLGGSSMPHGGPMTPQDLDGLEREAKGMGTELPPFFMPLHNNPYF